MKIQTRTIVNVLTVVFLIAAMATPTAVIAGRDHYRHGHNGYSNHYGRHDRAYYQPKRHYKRNYRGNYGYCRHNTYNSRYNRYPQSSYGYGRNYRRNYQPQHNYSYPASALLSISGGIGNFILRY